MLRSAFRLLYWEGAFAMAYETWVGPTYLSGLAGELGVPVIFVSVVTAASWIGSMGQLVGAWAYERVPSTKRYTLAVAIAARASWAAPLGLAAYWGWRSYATGAEFPVRPWFGVTAGVACLASLFSTSSSSAWMAWMNGLVPERFRGRFFGIRQRAFMVALMAANLTASFWVGWKPQGFRLGYGMICALALACAAASTWLLARVPERARGAVGAASGAMAAREARHPARGGAGGAATSALPGGGRDKPFAEALREPFRSPSFRRVLLFNAAFNGAVQLAGPYFTYYYTKELRLPMSLVALWAVMSNAGCLVASGFWGSRIDRGRGPIPTLRLCTLLMAASPLPYLIRSPAAIRWIAPIEFFSNGAAWAGYSLAITAILLAATPRERGAVYFSVHAAAIGLTGAACNFLGGRLAEWLLPWGGFRALWLAASAARFAVVLWLIPLLNLNSRD